MSSRDFTIYPVVTFTPLIFTANLAAAGTLHFEFEGDPRLLEVIYLTVHLNVLYMSTVLPFLTAPSPQAHSYV